MPLRSVSNPPNPWASVAAEWLEEAPVALPTVYEEEAKSVISTNRSPDVGFRHSVNPYRGCWHACAYCYARPSHQYWDLGAGTDFDRKIIVKVNAAQRLQAAFDARSWRGEPITFSGNTDCYQPLEASWRLTQRCLEVCLAYRNPVCIITKSALIRRDLDLLAQLHATAGLVVFVSIPFLDEAMCRAIEPGAPTPKARLATMRALAERGIPVGLALAPIIPALNESQIPAILQAAYDHGARRAFRVLLRLPREVEPVFTERLHEAFPDRAARVLAGLRDCRDGEVNVSAFGARMRGTGERWRMIEQVFDLHARRLGYTLGEDASVGHTNEPSPFRRPGPQLSLFDS